MLRKRFLFVLILIKLLFFLNIYKFKGDTLNEKEEENKNSKNEVKKILKIIRFSKIIKGQSNFVIFESNVDRDKLSVYKDDKLINIYKIGNDRYLSFILYDLLSKKKKGNIKIKANGYLDIERNYNIVSKEMKKQRIYLPKQSYSKDERFIRGLYSELLNYENRKTSSIIENNFYSIMIEGKFKWPIKGNITSEFGVLRSYNGNGFYSYHRGIDIGGVDINSQVFAPNNGVVIFSENLYARGKTIILAHGLGIKTLYYHLNDIKVKKGDLVDKGELIGNIGTTGFSTGPHLHWEARINNNIIDPNFLLNTNLEEFINE